VASSISHRNCLTALTTSGPAAGSANTGGVAATITHPTRPTAPTSISRAAGSVRTDGKSTTIKNQTSLTPATPTGPTFGCANTGDGSLTNRNHSHPTTASPTSPVAGSTAGRTTGRGRGLSCPVPHALSSVNDFASAATTAVRRLGSGGHSSAGHVPIA